MLSWIPGRVWNKLLGAIEWPSEYGYNTRKGARLHQRRSSINDKYLDQKRSLKVEFWKVQNGETLHTLISLESFNFK
jgi:hypothetical protein